MRARSSFMTRASDMREHLYFADPATKMKAIQLNCTDAYGAMLWDLSSDHTESFCKAWNIQARHCWNIDRKTHVYLVENYFCSNLVSLRNQIYSRYSNFAKTLNDSPSREVKLLFKVLSKDARSLTRIFSFLTILSKWM